MRFFTFILIFLLGLASVYAQEAQKPLPPDVEFKGLLSQANILLMKGDNEKAMSCLVSALKLNPSSSVCNFEIARLFFGDNDYDGALSYGLQAFKLNPKNRWYAYLLGAVYEKRGDYDNASKYYDLFLGDDSIYEDYEAFLDFQLRFHKEDDAIKTINKMEDLFGFQTLFCLQRAELYTKKNDIKSAAEEYKRIIRTDSSNLSAYGLLEELYYSHGKLAEAQEVQNKIKKIDPNNPLSQLSQAMLCRSSGKVDCFYQNLSESFKSDKISIQDKLLIISDIVNDQKFFDEDRVEGLFQVLNDFFPESSLVHTNFSDFYLYINKPEKSLEQLELAVKHNQSEYKNFHNIFQLYFITENYESLRKFVDEALDLYPDVAEVYLYSAVANMYLGKFSDAEDDFSTAMDFGIVVSPVAHYYWYFYALYNYLLDNKDVAFDYFDKYYNANHLDWYFVLRYVYCLVDSKRNMTLAGNLLVKTGRELKKYYYHYFVDAYYNFQKGNNDDAQKDIMTALQLKDSKPAVYELAGDIMKQKNDCTSALKNWQTAIDKGGDAIEINKKIQKCK